jgi:hypothetical protein
MSNCCCGCDSGAVEFRRIRFSLPKFGYGPFQGVEGFPTYLLLSRSGTALSGTSAFTSTCANEHSLVEVGDSWTIDPWTGLELYNGDIEQRAARVQGPVTSTTPTSRTNSQAASVSNDCSCGSLTMTHTLSQENTIEAVFGRINSVLSLVTESDVYQNVPANSTAYVGRSSSGSISYIVGGPSSALAACQARTGQAHTGYYREKVFVLFKKRMTYRLNGPSGPGPIQIAEPGFKLVYESPANYIPSGDPVWEAYYNCIENMEYDIYGNPLTECIEPDLVTLDVSSSVGCCPERLYVHRGSNNDTSSTKRYDLPQYGYAVGTGWGKKRYTTKQVITQATEQRTRGNSYYESWRHYGMTPWGPFDYTNINASNTQQSGGGAINVDLTGNIDPQTGAETITGTYDSNYSETSTTNSSFNGVARPPYGYTTNAFGTPNCGANTNFLSRAFQPDGGYAYQRSDGIRCVRYIELSDNGPAYTPFYSHFWYPYNNFGTPLEFYNRRSCSGSKSVPMVWTNNPENTDCSNESISQGGNSEITWELAEVSELGYTYSLSRSSNASLNTSYQANGCDYGAPCNNSEDEENTSCLDVTRTNSDTRTQEWAYTETVIHSGLISYQQSGNLVQTYNGGYAPPPWEYGISPPTDVFYISGKSEVFTPEDNSRQEMTGGYNFQIASSWHPQGPNWAANNTDKPLRFRLAIYTTDAVVNKENATVAYTSTIQEEEFQIPPQSTSLWTKQITGTVPPPGGDKIHYRLISFQVTPLPPPPPPDAI